ncbi:IclR family transcriptional regulator domain-containing protein [Microbacterium shaanxiense]
MARNVDALLQISSSFLEELAQGTGKTVNLTLRVGPHTRMLMVVGTCGHTEMERSGAVHPAYATAAGRVSLAGVSDVQLEHLFRGPASERTGAALDDAAFTELMRELNRTRNRGYALSREEAVMGISAVAFPVSAHHQQNDHRRLPPSARFDALLEDNAKMKLIRGPPSPSAGSFGSRTDAPPRAVQE